MKIASHFLSATEQKTNEKNKRAIETSSNYIRSAKKAKMKIILILSALLSKIIWWINHFNFTWFFFLSVFSFSCNGHYGNDPLFHWSTPSHYIRIAWDIFLINHSKLTIKSMHQAPEAPSMAFFFYSLTFFIFSVDFDTLVEFVFILHTQKAELALCGCVRGRIIIEHLYSAKSNK